LAKVKAEPLADEPDRRDAIAGGRNSFQEKSVRCIHQLTHLTG
jgi:hypothetical protein